MFGKLLAIAVTACCLSGAALAQKLTVASDTPVTLPGTQQLIVHSPSLNRDFQIRISPPSGKLNPGDDAPPGTPGTGEDVCPQCSGSGKVQGAPCQNCDGTGVVIKGVAGG